MFMLLSTFCVLALTIPQAKTTIKIATCLYLSTSVFMLRLNFWVRYFFFESVLIIILVIIVTLGLNPYRVRAMFWILVYSLLFSTSSLASIILNNKLMTPLILLKPLFLIPWRGVLLYIIFFTKVPVYLLHFWLPKAHVEASTYGSIFLAALLLKLGSFGCLKVFMWAKKGFGTYYFMLSGCLVLITCVFQRDIKKLIALTSVYHMSLSLVLLFRKTPIGLKIFFLINACHTIIRSVFFYTSGVFMKIRSSRIIFLQEINKFNIKAVLLVGTFLANLGAPPFFSLMVEIFSYSLVFKQIMLYLRPILTAILCTIVYRFLFINNIKYSFYKNTKSLVLIKNVFILNLVVIIIFL